MAICFAHRSVRVLASIFSHHSDMSKDESKDRDLSHRVSHRAQTFSPFDSARRSISEPRSIFSCSCVCVLFVMLIHCATRMEREHHGHMSQDPDENREAETDTIHSHDRRTHAFEVDSKCSQAAPHI